MICNVKSQFPDFPEPLPQIDGFLDSSFSKDGAPSISIELEKNTWLTVFIHYPNKENDFQIEHKYHVTYQNMKEHDSVICATDDLEQAKYFIYGFLKGFEKCSHL